MRRFELEPSSFIAKIIIKKTNKKREGEGRKGGRSGYWDYHWSGYKLNKLNEDGSFFLNTNLVPRVSHLIPGPALFLINARNTLGKETARSLMQWRRFGIFETCTLLQKQLRHNLQLFLFLIRPLILTSLS